VVVHRHQVVVPAHHRRVAAEAVQVAVLEVEAGAVARARVEVAVQVAVLEVAVLEVVEEAALEDHQYI
jgi:uncharacterized membrane protein (UPF0127 family)